MRSEEEVRTQQAKLEQQWKDYHRIAIKDLSIGAFAAVVMEYQIARKIDVLKWVLQES